MKQTNLFPLLSLLKKQKLRKEKEKQEKDTNLSLMAREIPFVGLFFSMSCTFSMEYPATFSLLICKIWSPKRSPVHKLKQM